MTTQEVKGTMIKEVLPNQQTGGNVMVDFVYFHDGRYLGINDEIVVLYDADGNPTDKHFYLIDDEK